jgi:sporulation protein YlmC with PRC-barrel domain
MRTLTSLIGREVATEDGRPLGSCHDLRGELASSSLRVTALVVGRRGWLEHLGIRTRARRDAIPWEAVTRIEGALIVVRDDAVPEDAAKG